MWAKRSPKAINRRLHARLFDAAATRKFMEQASTYTAVRTEKWSMTWTKKFTREAVGP